MCDDDPFRLKRFVSAQAPVISDVLRELHEGRKRSHWMWFIFPQLRGLGRSSTAMLYGIGSLGEARAYLTHPVLGPRLVRCTKAVLAIQGSTLSAIFGSPDDVKFCSSMTLFSYVIGESQSTFRQALDGCCGGADQRTLAILEQQDP